MTLYFIKWTGCTHMHAASAWVRVRLTVNGATLKLIAHGWHAAQALR
jgi:hypothetical protein